MGFLVKAKDSREPFHTTHAFVVCRLVCGGICILQGTSVTYVEASDADDNELLFDIVGDADVLAAGPLLRIVRQGQKRASVFLNSRLNAVVCLSGLFHQ